MFWTEIIRQRTIFEQDEYQSSSAISKLIALAEEAFPECDQNFHRQFAFLTHEATQNFLAPLLKDRFGNLPAAKVPTLEWLCQLGSFETFARSTRNGIVGSSPAQMKIHRTPEWHSRYCGTSRYREMVKRAEESWLNVAPSLTCLVNSRHCYEVMHHSDYGRMGEGDEFRYMVPLCNACHASISARGPRLPSVPPEAVKRWV